MRSGAGPPSSTTGNDDDFYYNTVNRLFYGPKTNGEWPVIGVMNNVDRIQRPVQQRFDINIILIVVVVVLLLILLVQ